MIRYTIKYRRRDWSTIEEPYTYTDNISALSAVKLLERITREHTAIVFWLEKQHD